MNKIFERLYNGLIKENPTFVLALGMCPTLAVTTSAMNGLGMGLTTAAVLTLSNAFISLLRKVIPNRVRIPAFIVIIASFVTVVQLLLQAYIPSLYGALGIYIPLIVVNCIILGRAEAYAYHNPVVPSLFDGLGMGLGFSFALTCIGAFRELLGAGEIFGYRIMPTGYVPIAIFIMAPGAFFVLAMLTAAQNKLKKYAASKNDEESLPKGCNSDCASCGDGGCSFRLYDESEPVESEPKDVKAEKQKSKDIKSKDNKLKENKSKKPKVEKQESENAEFTEFELDDLEAVDLEEEEEQIDE